MALVLKSGEAAYLDSFTGLVPVKVLSIAGVGLSATVKYQVTGTVGAYKEGDVDNMSARWVLPVDALCYNSEGQARVKAYTVQPD